MNYSKETKSFVYSLVCNYSHYDNLSELFDVYFDNVDRDELYQLSALIMLDSPDAAYEATSIENPSYQKMQNALILSLQNPLDGDSREDFHFEWQEGILNYFKKSIIDLLDDALEIYNQEMAA